jgi:hypothetical protein
MKKAYVAGPYKAPTYYQRRQNIAAAEAVAVELLRMGYAVFCPHRNYGGLDGVISEFDFLERDLAHLEDCQLVVVLPGYEASEGTKAEIHHAHNELVPVYYWPEDREQIVRAVNDPDPFAEYAAEEPVIIFEPDSLLERALNGGPDD